MKRSRATIVWLAVGVIVVLSLALTCIARYPPVVHDVKPRFIILRPERSPDTSRDGSCVRPPGNDPEYDHIRERNHDHDHIRNHDRRTDSIGSSSRLVPVNVRTRGGLDQYAQVGVIATAVDDETSSPPRILPLFGRPTYGGSHKWNFYTTTDGYHLLQIPIFYKNRNCTTEYGCDEVSDGDYVRVEEYGGTFRVRMYENDQLRYLPW